MRRTAYRLIAACLLGASLGASLAPAHAQSPAQPPHSWLFGTWSGGLFPAPSGMSNQACLSQPIVIFTRDLVLRATITEQTLTQREVETVRAIPGGAEFRFAATAGGSTLLGTATGPAAGFGCDGPDVLRVQRRGENEISFPGCADFPNPLVRCQTR